MFDRLAPVYDTVIPFFATFGHALVEIAGIGAGESVLDIASGRGACTFPAVEAVGPTGRVHCRDLSAGMVDALRADLDGAGLTGVDVAVGDATDLDLDDGSVDVVVGGFMIFFLPAPAVALREFHRVLRPGGRVALSVFDGPVLLPWLPQPDQTFRVADAVADAMRATGFDDTAVVDVQRSFSFPDVDTVLAWMRVSMYRNTVVGLDAAGLDRLRADVGERLAPMRTDDGYVLEQRVAVIRGTRVA